MGSLFPPNLDWIPSEFDSIFFDKQIPSGRYEWSTQGKYVFVRFREKKIDEIARLVILYKFKIVESGDLNVFKTKQIHLVKDRCKIRWY